MNQTTAPPRLRRSTTDRKLGGVAGGLGEYLGVDPVLIRVIFVLLAFAGGTGVIAYLAAWVLMPEDDGSAPTPRSTASVDDATKRTLGIVLLVVATGLMLGSWWWDDGFVLPAVLIGAGVFLVLRPDPRSSSTTSLDHPNRPDDAAPADAVAPTTDEPAAPAPPPPVPAPAPAPRARNSVARVTTGLVALLAGGLGAAVAAGASIDLRTGVLWCLAVVGGGLVVGAFLGGARSLLLLAIPLVGLLAVVSAVHIPLEGGIGDRSYRPESLDEVEARYRLGAGDLLLDLRSLPATELSTQRVPIEVSLGVGQLRVLTPPDVTVVVDSEVGVGQLVVFGHSIDGTSLHTNDTRTGAEGAGTIELDIRAGLGDVSVR